MRHMCFEVKISKGYFVFTEILSRPFTISVYGQHKIISVN